MLSRILSPVIYVFGSFALIVLFYSFGRVSRFSKGTKIHNLKEIIIKTLFALFALFILSILSGFTLPKWIFTTEGIIAAAIIFLVPFGFGLYHANKST